MSDPPQPEEPTTEAAPDEAAPPEPAVAAFAFVTPQGEIRGVTRCQAAAAPFLLVPPGCTAFPIEPDLPEVIGRELRAWRLIDRSPVRKAEPPYALDRTTITADGEDAAVLTGVPAGADIAIQTRDGAAGGAADGTAVEIASSRPGRITVTVRSLAYLDWRMSVDAV